MATKQTDISFPPDRSREDPIYKPATNPANDPKHSAAFIFVHGLADSAAAIENVGDQFQQGNKLPHMSWIFPNAKHNNITMDKAWFTPNSLPYLTPSRPELVPDEDEEGMLETVAYLESLIDAVVESGVPAKRIVLGGFSQGCAMSLLTHLTSSKYSRQLAGIAGLLGYLPLSDQKQRIQEIRAERGLKWNEERKVPVFLARGTKDEFIPRRAWLYTVEALKELGVEEAATDVRLYEGLTHTLNGALLQDLCTWLEKVVPAVE
ncbi:hypothetical protein PRZ48_000799 [Zasmidium cellare]|uniref:Acyl-protein thioesterase 1 n=1 Tax=Zasmidium cellare TaxID=395010 RepID=A0ABR0F038_ZASCE|nr:hypothetical protein PRZ48_000799 [Zasmidium cellare]